VVVVKLTGILKSASEFKKADERIDLVEGAMKEIAEEFEEFLKKEIDGIKDFLSVKGFPEELRAWAEENNFPKNLKEARDILIEGVRVRKGENIFIGFDGFGQDDQAYIQAMLNHYGRMDVGIKPTYFFKR